MAQKIRVADGRFREGDTVRLTFADFGSVDMRIVRVLGGGYYEVRRIGSLMDRFVVFVSMVRMWLGV